MIGARQILVGTDYPYMAPEQPWTRRCARWGCRRRARGHHLEQLLPIPRDQAAAIAMKAGPVAALVLVALLVAPVSAPALGRRAADVGRRRRAGAGVVRSAEATGLLTVHAALRAPRRAREADARQGDGPSLAESWSVSPDG